MLKNMISTIHNWETRKTEHYVFNYIPDSFAHRNLKSIINLQEFCYRTIIRQLRTKRLSFPIQYFLYDVNCKFDQMELDGLTGLARYPDQIHAVYSSEMKAVGYHEDVHIIAAQTIGDYSNLFFCEGLAMFFDEVWWGLPNKLWTQIFIKEQIYPGILPLLENEQFERLPSALTYPVCGTFTDFLIRNYGISRYKKLYNFSGEADIRGSFKDVLHINVEALEKSFIQYVENSHYASGMQTFVSSIPAGNICCSARGLLREQY